MAEGKVDLAPVLAQLRRDERHTEERKDLLLARERLQAAVRTIHKTAGREPVAASKRHVPEASQEPIRAGRPEERRAAPAGIGEPDVQGHPVEGERDPVPALAGCDTAHEGGPVTGGDDIEPVDGARPPAVTPRNCITTIAQERRHAREGGVGLRPGDPVRPPAELPDAALDRLLPLWAEPPERPEPAAPHRPLQVVHGQDPEPFPEDVQRPRPDAGNAEQVDDRCRNGGPHIVELVKRPGLRNLPDLPGYPGAYTRDADKLLHVEPGDRKGEPVDRPRRPPVGLAPVAVLSRNLKQAAHNEELFGNIPVRDRSCRCPHDHRSFAIPYSR
ncbi:MAG: hypothetical protein BWX50_00980 [Euryarchaeota archaeon ADurb.Bin009]|nr:MAG: hypothetical protein BWX50_00980 [Euryarchaeota archaeon ADurb.Bin009]